MEKLDGQVFVVKGGMGAMGRSVVEDRPEVDLLDAGCAEALVRDVLAREGRLDGLIHTVGGFTYGPLHEAPLADYDRMFDLNVRTLFHVARALVPLFLQTKRGFLAALSSEPGWSG